MGAGAVSGFVTAFLQTKMGIESILAGIIVNTGLYTINIAAMGFASNLNLFGCDSIFTWAKARIGCGYGWHCIYAMEHGASSVVGVDISHKMSMVKS